MDGSKDFVLDANSPATKYEVMLLEKGRERPSEDGVVLVFRLLDELIPHLGVYTKLISLARDELFDSVYSSQYTGQMDKNTSYIQRVPYFTLMRRVHAERNEEADALRDQLEEVKQRLFEKHTQLGEVEEQVSSLQCQVEDLQEKIGDMEEKLVDKNAEIDRLEDVLESTNAETDAMREQLEGDIYDLKDALKESTDELAYMSQFKQGFDDLQRAFNDRAQEKDISVQTQKQAPVIANPKSHLVGNITSAQNLERQLLNVQNALIEEFDLFMESHKSSLQSLPADASKLTEDDYNELDQSAQEMLVMVQRFLQRTEELNTELQLIDQHRSMLQEQLQNMTAGGAPVKKANNSLDGQSNQRKGSKASTGSHPRTQDSVLSAGLEREEPETARKDDPFIPNERIFSKYAAMLYTSDNGSTFHEFVAAKYCASCGEKTVFCPHKIGNREQIFALPPMTTHIKVTRPKVKINHDVEQFECQNEKTESKKQLLPNSLSQSSFFNTPELTVASLSAVWDDYKMRTAVQRSIPRALSLERTLALMEEFAAILLWHDESLSEQASAQSVMDELFAWLNDRYQHSDIGFLVAHDLLTSVLQHAPCNKVVQIFGHVLTSDLDSSAWRYLMLMADFIMLVDWAAVEDFRSFAEVIYPFLTEDDIENLQMGYTSFSENKMSPLLVCEYIIYLILKGREPLFNEFEGRLVSYPGCDQNDLSEQEFLNAADNIIAVLDQRLCIRLYRSAAAGNHGNDNGRVLVQRLGQMLAYMGLLQLAPVIKESVGQKVIDARQNIESENLRGRLVPIEGKIITMETVKTLATNLARCQESQRLFENRDDETPDYLSYKE